VANETPAEAPEGPDAAGSLLHQDRTRPGRRREPQNPETRAQPEGAVREQRRLWHRRHTEVNEKLAGPGPFDCAHRAPTPEQHERSNGVQTGQSNDGTGSGTHG